MGNRLYRPVGLKELELIYDSGFKRFPPRLVGQPIFYPVLNEEYAVQIAHDWNVKDKVSGFSGFVTCFEVDSDFINRYKTHIVGSRKHEEYWIPAEELTEFNDNIIGSINVLSAYYGKDYVGYDSQKFMLGNKSVIEQFLHLYKIKEYSGFDFVLEIQANQKMVYFNFPYWVAYDFSSGGISIEEKQKLVASIKTIWENKIKDIVLIE